MDALLLVHVVGVSTWAGLVLGEGALELGCRDTSTRQFAARAHFWLDVLVELPLIIAVVTSGSLLLLRAGTLPALLWMKVALALVAVVLNLACIALVIQRRLRVGDDAAVARISQRIRVTGLGVPFGLAAAVIGFASA
jgi:hypothetical protein